MTSARVDHKAKKDDDSGLPIPEGFGHIIMADAVILASDINQGAKGAAGEKDALFIKDAYSGARMIITQTNHTKENNISGLQYFIGPNVSSSKIILKSDAAQELTGAAEALKWLPEPSLPNRWPHNSRLERDVRTVKEAMRSVHYQAGFDHELWPISFRYAAMALNFKQQATYKPEVTQWEAVSGEPFNGPQVPLGALVYYRSKEPRAAHSPNALPGIFAGWRIESGFRYRKDFVGA